MFLSLQTLFSDVPVLTSRIMPRLKVEYRRSALSGVIEIIMSSTPSICYFYHVENVTLYELASEKAAFSHSFSTTESGYQILFRFGGIRAIEARARRM